LERQAARFPSLKSLTVEPEKKVKAGVRLRVATNYESSFRFDDACQTNLLMAKFCADEARIDFLRDIPYRVDLRCVCSNASAEFSQIR
jgi:hypothetical protein